MENNQQGRRKPDNQVLTNPAKFFIQWKSKDEAFIYYNKDKKVDVKMPKPFVFIPLSMAYTLKGYNQKKQKSYIANEIENIETDILSIRSYDVSKKANTEWTGTFKDLKEVMDDNIKYTISLYAAIKSKKGEMTLVNLQLNGAALFHWFEFAKKNDIWSNAIKVEKDTDEKNGAVKYKAPVYELSSISDEDDIEAGKLQTEIESYLKEYYAKNRASNPAPKVDENQNNGLNAKPAAKKAESKPKVDEKEEVSESEFDPNEIEDDDLPF
tara:strand:- start:3815 stop:4618 length:804 start_codon:yes stop_codon:yes gene_type:complete